MLVTRYQIQTDLFQGRYTIAVCGDLHDKSRNGKNCIKLLEQLSPDLILLPGDIVENHAFPLGYGLDFLKQISSIAPCFMSLGNHETGGRHHFIHGKDIILSSDSDFKSFLQSISDTGVKLLNNEFVCFGSLVIGGAPSPLWRDSDHHLFTKEPDLGFLKTFSETQGYKILLFHHPELFEKYIASFPVQLTLAGHAHGGQVRLFGKGIYAPGQGLFPKLTSGIHTGNIFPDRQMIITKGLSNNTPFPRLFNPPELVVLSLIGT